MDVNKIVLWNCILFSVMYFNVSYLMDQEERGVENRSVMKKEQAYRVLHTIDNKLAPFYIRVRESSCYLQEKNFWRLIGFLSSLYVGVKAFNYFRDLYPKFDYKNGLPVSSYPMLYGLIASVCATGFIARTIYTIERNKAKMREFEKNENFKYITGKPGEISQAFFNVNFDKIKNYNENNFKRVSNYCNFASGNHHKGFFDNCVLIVENIANNKKDKESAELWLTVYNQIVGNDGIVKTIEKCIKENKSVKIDGEEVVEYAPGIYIPKKELDDVSLCVEKKKYEEFFPNLDEEKKLEIKKFFEFEEARKKTWNNEFGKFKELDEKKFFELNQFYNEIWQDESKKIENLGGVKRSLEFKQFCDERWQKNLDLFELFEKFEKGGKQKLSEEQLNQLKQIICEGKKDFFGLEDKFRNEAEGKGCLEKVEESISKFINKEVVVGGQGGEA